MPYGSPTFGITAPCLGEPITVAALQAHVLSTEAALVTVNATALKARTRPAVTVTGVTAYTAGVAVVPSFNTEIVDTDNMFTLSAPTVLTVNTPGTYLINFICSSNLLSTNTSHRGEILVNGNPIASMKQGLGVAGLNGPANPMQIHALAPLLVGGNTISVRVTVTGVGNDNIFPSLSATLISYGGS